MRYPRPEALTSALYVEAERQFVILEAGHAYLDNDAVVLAHPDCFDSTHRPVRPGYGKTISAGNRRRETVSVENPFGDKA